MHSIPQKIILHNFSSKIATDQLINFHNIYDMQRNESELKDRIVQLRLNKLIHSTQHGFMKKIMLNKPARVSRDNPHQEKERKGRHNTNLHIFLDKP